MDAAQVLLSIGQLFASGVSTLHIVPPRSLLAAIAKAPAVALAPSRDEGGTNAVALAPPDLMALKFGPDSFHEHQRQAVAANARPIVLRRPGLALDIDTVDDLVALIDRGAAGRTGAYLEESGIIRRIEDCGAQTGICG